MKKLGYIALVFVLFAFSAGVVSAVEVTCFDELFQRKIGQPRKESHAFSALPTLATVKVYNGDGDHWLKRATAATVKINGDIVFKASDFKKREAYLEAQVGLLDGENSIDVTLLGIPGVKFRVEVVQEMEGPFSSPSDPDKIINDEGSVYPVNEILINLADEASNEDAQEIAASIRGSIIGFVPSIKLLQIKVPVASKEELKSLAEELENSGNSFIEGVFFNYLPALLNIDDHDLTRNEIGDRIDAYRKIELIKAYDYLLDKNPPFKHIRVGIIDSGLEKSHIELSNLDWGDTPDVQPGGHGTSVTGIIGANNLKGEMNGIIAGIPNPNSDYGSKIEYTIEYRDSSSFTTTHKIFAIIDELAIKNVKIINMSFAWTKKSWLQMNPLDVLLGGVVDNQFYAITLTFYDIAEEHNSILFVTGAGNNDIDASNVVPACVETENFITVGATNLDDTRGVWRDGNYKSNFGLEVDIAAPGEKVYAPTSSNGYDYFEATSAASPMVTGTVGLLLAIDDTLTPAEIKEILKETGNTISTDKPIGKRLNAFNAVKRVLGDDDATSSTQRVSVSSDGVQGNDYSNNSSISADGRFVAFVSLSSTLVSGDTNGAWDVFIHDRQTGETTRVSVSSDGVQGSVNDISKPTISTDGRFVAFVSLSSTLVSGDTNGAWDVFVHDRQTGETTRVSVGSDGVQGNYGCSYPESSISADGRFVAFASYANNLVSGDTNRAHDVFVHDRQTGETTRVSITSDGVQGNYGYGSYYPSISADGRFVAFVSLSSTLVSGDTNGAHDVFVHDRQTGETTRVSVSSDGVQGNAYGSLYPSISADGRFVVFCSDSDNLVSGDTNGLIDVFVHDRQTGETTRVSVSSDGVQGNYGNYEPSISADGRFVVFSSVSDNLVTGDTNRADDVFMHDRQTGETTLVSVSSDGVQGNYGNYRPSISADGRFVAFSSVSDNLISGDTNRQMDIFVHDRGQKITY